MKKYSIAIVANTLLFSSLFLPWTIVQNIFKPITSNAFETNDGKILLILTLLSFIFFAFRPNKTMVVIMFAFGFVSCVITIMNFIQIQEKTNSINLNNEYAITSIGIGLYLAVVTSIILR